MHMYNARIHNRKQRIRQTINAANDSFMFNIPKHNDPISVTPIRLFNVFIIS